MASERHRQETGSDQQQASNASAGGMRGADRLVLVGAGVLAAGVAVLAFAVSFDAISAHAVATGAFPPALGWAAPLLVDTFTVAATLVVFARSRAHVRAPFAWTYVAAATLVSLALNVAHAPDRLDAQLIAALPPLAQLAAIELLMSEARRFTREPAEDDVMPEEEDGPEPVKTARDRIRRLLADARANGGRVTGLRLPRLQASASAARSSSLRVPALARTTRRQRPRARRHRVRRNIHDLGA